MNRHFLNWSAPLLPQAARLLVEHYGGEDRGDGARGERDPVARMDGAVVALPGARAGRRLKELLVEAAAEAGVRLVPPRIVTLGVLPELLYETEQPFAPDLLRGLVWARAFMAQAASEGDHQGLSTVFAALPASDDLADWSGLAREFSSVSREVAAGAHDFASVADTCGGTPLYNDQARWRVLSRVQDRVTEELAALGRVDRDRARMDALRSGAVTSPGDIWLVGAAETTPVLARMLIHLGDDPSAGGAIHAVVHAPEDRADDFDALGRIRVERWAEATVELADETLHVEDRPHDQAERVVRILAGLDGDWAAEDLALGVPRPDVIPAVEATLSSAGVDVREAAGRPVSRTGPYRLLEAVAAFLADRRYDALAPLLRHPDLVPWLGVPEVADPGGEGVEEADDGTPARPSRPWSWEEALDAWYTQHLPTRMVAPYRDQARGAGRVVRQLMERLDELLQPLGASRPLSEWSEPIVELLRTVYAERGLDPSSLAQRASLQALGRLGEVAQGLAGLPEAVDRPVTGRVALRLVLQEAAASPPLPPAPDAEAVEMLGWLELHLDDAPVTVVTGVNEGDLPESVRGDTFLPDSLRHLLGLEDNRQRYARDLYRLTAMVRSRKVLHLVSGRRSMAGDPLRPSRLLFATDEETVRRRVRRFWSAEEEEGTRVVSAMTDSPATGPSPDGPASGTGSGFVLPPEPFLPEPDESALPDAMSVTEFSTLLDDPYTWALRRFRHLEPLNDRHREMDPGLFGSLAHEILEDFGRGEVERHAGGEILADAESVWSVLEPLLDARVTERFGPDAGAARVAVRLQVEQLRARLRAFAAWHARWVGQGWRVRAAETGTGEDESGRRGLPFPFEEGAPEDGRTVRLKARIDRIDHHPGTGEWAVFDYKTSDTAKKPEKTHRKGQGEDRDWTDLQLPLYRWLAPRLPHWRAAGVAGPGEDDEIRVGYILLPRTLDAVGDAMAEWDRELVESGVDRARALLRELAAGPVAWDEDRAPSWSDPELDALTGRSVLAAAGGDDDEEDEA